MNSRSEEFQYRLTAFAAAKYIQHSFRKGEIEGCDTPADVVAEVQSRMCGQISDEKVPRWWQGFRARFPLVLESKDLSERMQLLLQAWVVKSPVSLPSGIGDASRRKSMLPSWKPFGLAARMAWGLIALLALSTAWLGFTVWRDSRLLSQKAQEAETKQVELARIAERFEALEAERDRLALAVEEASKSLLELETTLELERGQAQNLRLKLEQARQSLNSPASEVLFTQLFLDDERATGNTVQLEPETREVVVLYNLAGLAPAETSYRFELQTSPDGVLKWAATGDLPINQLLALSFPVAFLKPGEYRFVLYSERERKQVRLNSQVVRIEFPR